MVLEREAGLAVLAAAGPGDQVTFEVAAAADFGGGPVAWSQRSTAGRQLAGRPSGCGRAPGAAGSPCPARSAERAGCSPERGSLRPASPAS